MGISLAELACGKIPNGKMHKIFVDAGRELLAKTEFNSAFIFGGFPSERHGIFLRACQKEALQEETSPGVYVIGIGQVAAMEQLSKRGQNVHMSLARTLLHVYEAMHVAQSRFVGPPPELAVVIRKREEKVMVYPFQSLEGWRKTYESKNNTASLDDSSVASTEVWARMKVMREGGRRFSDKEFLGSGR